MFGISKFEFKYFALRALDHLTYCLFLLYRLGMARTSAPKEVVQLVERFDRNRDPYRAGGINETQLRREFLKASTAPDKTAIERQIAATGKLIDALVYELYGLTEEEIRVVEDEK